MPTRAPVPLRDALVSLALSVVESQKIFDREYRRGADPLIPLLRITEWECTLAMSVDSTVATGFGVSVQPVNLGFSITHERTVSNASSVTLVVQQTPAPHAGRK